MAAAIEIPFPTGEEPSPPRVADWVELTASFSGAPFKRGDLKSALGGEFIKNPDRLEQEVWLELSLRAGLMGSRWPLRFQDDFLSRRSRSLVPLRLYRFMCLLGLGDLIENSDRTKFEELVAWLLTPLCGSNVLRVGHPASFGQPTSFRERIDRYRVRAGMHDDERGKDLLPTDKDLGLDVVGWNRFDDGRGADLHFWVQCATGTDWEEKLSELDLNVWRSHIDWGVQPIRLFATPFVLTQPGAKWLRISRKGGLILDRPRLMRLASRMTMPQPILSDLSARVNACLAA